MSEAVLFPDVEQLVCDKLRGLFPGGTIYPSGYLYPSGFPVGIKVPTTRPPEFIRVLRTGGIRETLRSEAAQITVEAWAQTEQRASAILAQARAIINRSEGALFGARELSGPINLPDPTTAQIRYTMSFQIRARGQSMSV